MGEVPSRHSEDRVIRRIELMKGLHRTVASGLFGGAAGALMGATAFLAVNVLMPSVAEAQWRNSAGGNIYGDSRVNPMADPRVNPNADTRVNPCGQYGC